MPQATTLVYTSTESSLVTTGLWRRMNGDVAVFINETVDRLMVNVRDNIARKANGDGVVIANINICHTITPVRRGYLVVVSGIANSLPTHTESS